MTCTCGRDPMSRAHSSPTIAAAAHIQQWEAMTRLAAGRSTSSRCAQVAPGHPHRLLACYGSRRSVPHTQSHCSRHRKGLQLRQGAHKSCCRETNALQRTSGDRANSLPRRRVPSSASMTLGLSKLSWTSTPCATPCAKCVAHCTSLLRPAKPMLSLPQVRSSRGMERSATYQLPVLRYPPSKNNCSACWAQHALS